MKAIEIAKLRLFNENPRHEKLKTQSEMIENLIKEEYVVNLAKDIAKNGLNPLDVIGVVKKGMDAYTVLEGNRRLCACLLLNNPELCPTKDKNTFKELNEKYDIPKTITCKVFKNEEDADHWMQVRHEGAQGGIGTRDWNAIQKARHSERRGRKNPNILATKVLDYGLDNNLITEDEKNKIPITTLNRYLGNPVVKNAMGLDKKSKDLETRLDEDNFKRLITKFLKDAIKIRGKKSVVNSRTKSSDWEKYGENLRKLIKNESKKSGTNSGTNQVTNPGTNQVTNPGTNQVANPGTNQIKNTQANISVQNTTPGNRTIDPTKRNKLLPHKSKSKFSIQDKILRRVYKEIDDIDVEGHEFSIAFLLRAFIERTMFLYLEKYDSPSIQGKIKLKPKMEKVCAHLKDNKGIKDAKLTALKTAVNNQYSLLSPFVLGTMIHMGMVPQKRDLIAIWDSLEEILVIIHNFLANDEN